MLNILVYINEAYTNGYIVASISIISLICTLFAILVIISKNPIVSVLFLIGLFLGIACYLFMLGLNFIGLSYLLVYVGAVSILFLFILMLINVRISELLNETSKSIPLISIIVVCFSYSVIEILPFNISSFNESVGDINTTTISNSLNGNFTYYITDIFMFFANNLTIKYIFSKFWDGSMIESTHIASIGNIMYTSYCLWLIITSIILLLAMVGSIIITIKQSSSKSLQSSLIVSSKLHVLATLPVHSGFFISTIRNAVKNVTIFIQHCLPRNKGFMVTVMFISLFFSIPVAYIKSHYGYFDDNTPNLFVLFIVSFKVGFLATTCRTLWRSYNGYDTSFKSYFLYGAIFIILAPVLITFYTVVSACIISLVFSIVCSFVSVEKVIEMLSYIIGKNILQDAILYMNPYRDVCSYCAKNEDIQSVGLRGKNCKLCKNGFGSTKIIEPDKIKLSGARNDIIRKNGGNPFKDKIISLSFDNAKLAPISGTTSSTSEPDATSSTSKSNNSHNSQNTPVNK